MYVNFYNSQIEQIRRLLIVLLEKMFEEIFVLFVMCNFFSFSDIELVLFFFGFLLEFFKILVFNFEIEGVYSLFNFRNGRIIFNFLEIGYFVENVGYDLGGERIYQVFDFLVGGMLFEDVKEILLLQKDLFRMEFIIVSFLGFGLFFCFLDFVDFVIWIFGVLK